MSLDAPILHALTTAHKPIARTAGLALRYATGVSPLSALREFTPQAFADLRTLTEFGEKVAFFTTGPVEIPAGWEVLGASQIEQMVCDTPPIIPADAASLPFVDLRTNDVPDMLALTALTKPGPFLPRTIEMGRYLGIKSPDGRLAAMAGMRLQLDTHVEVSAVCTHPDFQGKGYAQALVATVAAHIVATGRTPFLHHAIDNPAKRVYERVGFRPRRLIHVTSITPQV